MHLDRSQRAYEELQGRQASHRQRSGAAHCPHIPHGSLEAQGLPHVLGRQILQAAPLRRRRRHPRLGPRARRRPGGRARGRHCHRQRPGGLDVPGRHDPVDQGKLPAGRGGGGQRGHFEAGRPPHLCRVRRAARGYGGGKHLHDAGGDGLRQAPGHVHLSGHALRQAVWHPVHRRRRDPQPGSHRQGSEPRCELRHDGLDARGEPRGARGVVLQGRAEDEEVQGDGEQGGDGQGEQHEVPDQFQGDDPCRAGGVGGGCGQGIAVPVPPPPPHVPPAGAAGHWHEVPAGAAPGQRGRHRALREADRRRPGRGEGPHGAARAGEHLPQLRSQMGGVFGQMGGVHKGQHVQASACRHGGQELLGMTNFTT
mmetsp:Transcript_11460/g.28493  ORF Transcript_11460/g.28493 Transcript_11460/m.28493 type:complete len:367 (+) Transcript_11460:865-1965(+)